MLNGIRDLFDPQSTGEDAAPVVEYIQPFILLIIDCTNSCTSFVLQMRIADKVVIRLIFHCGGGATCGITATSGLQQVAPGSKKNRYGALQQELPRESLSKVSTF